MKWSELIKKRRSIRTFDGEGLSDSEISEITEITKTAANPYGISIDWTVLDAKENGLSSIVIVGAEKYIAGKIRCVPHAEEAFGFSFEKIVLEVLGMGIGTTWIAGTMNRQAFEKAVSLGTDEMMPCVSPIGHPASKMSVRETVMRKNIGAEKRLPFEELFFLGSFEKPLSEADDEISFMLNMVRLAPSAVNKQPWRVVISGNKAHFYEKKSRGYVSEGGWDIQKIDIGIALCHFVLAAEESGFEPAFSVSEPDIVTPDGVSYVATSEWRKKG